MLGGTQIKYLTGTVMGFLLQFLQANFNLRTLLMQFIRINQRAVLFHFKQYRHDFHFDIGQYFGLLFPGGQLRPECLVQTQGNVGVFGGVGSCLIQSNLIKGQLLGTFTGDLFKVNGFVAQVFQRQAVHIVFGGDGIQHIRFEHGIEFHTFQMNTVVHQYVGIVFHMLANFFLVFIFQNGL